MAGNDPYDHLRGLLRRLDELLTDKGLARKDIVDIGKLSAATGLTDQEVRKLLQGRKLPPQETEEFVPRRVVFLQQRHEEGSGKRLPRMIADLTASGKLKEAWARLLLQGKRVPSLTHLAVLSEYFEVPVAFFTDPAPRALARELEPIVRNLEPDPLSELMDKLGIRAVHTRTPDGRPLSKKQQEKLAALIELVIGNEEDTRP